MTFDLSTLREVAAEGPVVRVVIVETRGSVPREVGASMLVRGALLSGTIGGGALEFDAIAKANACLTTGRDVFERVALGPALGQCCGGSADLLFEVWTTARLDGLEDHLARPLPGQTVTSPTKKNRRLGAWLATENRRPMTVEGWFVEPVTQPSRDIWIWGAGHVGRALVNVLSPLPGLSLTWLDIAQERFPSHIPAGIETKVSTSPAGSIADAHPRAEHFVLSHSHQLDLEICHQVLRHGSAFLGLIGSETKSRRFRKRLAEIGHDAGDIARLTCPIGDKTLGKHPHAIAIGVAAMILKKTPASIRLEAAE